jgi:cobalamin biosynthesis protein CbiD
VTSVLRRPPAKFNFGLEKVENKAHAFALTASKDVQTKFENAQMQQPCIKQIQEQVTMQIHTSMSTIAKQIQEQVTKQIYAYALPARRCVTPAVFAADIAARIIPRPDPPVDVKNTYLPGRYA